MLDKKLLFEELCGLDSKMKKRFEEFEENAKKHKLPLTDVIFAESGLDEKKMKKIFAKAYGVEEAAELPENLSNLTLKYVPLTMANAQHLAVFDESTEDICIATSNPDNSDIFDLLYKKIKKNLKIYFCFQYEIEKSLKTQQGNFDEKFANLTTGALKDISSIESLRDSSQLLDIILQSSLEHKASDIHIEPHEGRIIIRFRIDGVLEDIIELPMELADVITSRIKVLAELRTDEHFKPQDGRFKLILPDKSEITTRVSIIPVYDGEKAVMRILKAKQQNVQLTDLGYTKDNQEVIYSNVEKAHGMLLVTGPTGSGKTTTLYVLLKLLNKPGLNLMTIEDPIEYKLDRINQIQVNPAAGLTFASGLRSILRQDPDIVMVGEIRDEETASIAVNAALTGHLVLATLHTNSSIDTMPRLLEMGVEPYLVATTTNVVVAQRLLRQLCEKCKKKTKLTKKMLDAYNTGESDFYHEFVDAQKKHLKVGATIYEPGGCEKCSDTGFAGRLAIAEVLGVSDKIKALIYERKSPLDIEKAARSQGFVSLVEDGLIKVKEGSTSLEEVIRVIKE